MHILNLKVNLKNSTKFAIDFGLGLIGFQILGQLSLSQLGVVIDSKNTLEFAVGLIGLLSIFGSCVIYFTTMTLIARFQRLLDRTQVQLGDIVMRVCDLERFSHATHGYIVRQTFPSEFLPNQHTDF